MWVGLGAYIFLFFLMLVNIFLAILNDAYAVTKEGVEKQIEEKRELDSSPTEARRRGGGAQGARTEDDAEEPHSSASSPGRRKQKVSCATRVRAPVLARVPTR